MGSREARTVARTVEGRIEEERGVPRAGRRGGGGQSAHHSTLMTMSLPPALLEVTHQVPGLLVGILLGSLITASLLAGQDCKEITTLICVPSTPERETAEESLPSSPTTQPQPNKATNSCNAIGSHLTPRDPFNFLKLHLPPSECYVKGVIMEELDPANNFRRGWALGLANNVEDKTHLLPYLRASLDPSLHKSKRRILVDLGGRDFNSSIEWFIRSYPLDFTEMHVFEAVKGKFVLPLRVPDDIMGGRIIPMNKFSQRRPVQNPPPLPNWMLDRVKLHTNWVGTEPGKLKLPYWMGGNTIVKVNITDFIVNKLKIAPSDTLIVKMDIDGAEWSVLPTWLKAGVMSELVDELFVEVHYHHLTMQMLRWNERRFPHTREEAVQLFQELRSAGFYAHAWP